MKYGEYLRFEVLNLNLPDVNYTDVNLHDGENLKHLAN